MGETPKQILSYNIKSIDGKTYLGVISQKALLSENLDMVTSDNLPPRIVDWVSKFDKLVEFVNEFEIILGAGDEGIIQNPKLLSLITKPENCSDDLLDTITFVYTYRSNTPMVITLNEKGEDMVKRARVIIDRIKSLNIEQVYSSESEPKETMLADLLQERQIKKMEKELVLVNHALFDQSPESNDQMWLEQLRQLFRMSFRLSQKIGVYDHKPIELDSKHDIQDLEVRRKMIEDVGQFLESWYPSPRSVVVHEPCRQVIFAIQAGIHFFSADYEFDLVRYQNWSTSGQVIEEI